MQRARWPAESLLAGLSARTERAVLAAGTRTPVAAKVTLFQQDERGDHAYLLLSGTVKVFVDSPDGNRSLLGIAVAGEIVGEMALLRPGGRRSASVAAVTGLEVRSLSRAALERLVEGYPDFALGLQRMIAERLAFANRRRQDAMTKDRQLQMGRVLIEIARYCGRRVESGWDLGVPLTQHELGSLAGMKGRTAEKALKDLVDSGAIEQGYSGVRILDVDRLLTIAKVS